MLVHHKREEIEKIKELLGRVARLGDAQIHAHILEPQNQKKVRHDRGLRWIEIDGIRMPGGKGAATLLTEPRTFYFQNTESFWILYKSILDNLERPIIQFSLRTLLEIGMSKLVLYSTFPAQKQKEIATRFWLCTSGLLKDKEKFLALLEILEDVPERRAFEKIMENNFSPTDFHRKLHGILPSLNAPEVQRALKPVIEDLWAGNFAEKYFELVNRNLSMHVHGNMLMMQNLKREEIDGTHVYRVGIVMLICGITVTNLCLKKMEIQVISEHEIVSLKQEVDSFLRAAWKNKRQAQ